MERWQFLRRVLCETISAVVQLCKIFFILWAKIKNAISILSFSDAGKKKKVFWRPIEYVQYTIKHPVHSKQHTWPTTSNAIGGNFFYCFLCLSQALAVSDHFPVEVKLIGQAHAEWITTPTTLPRASTLILNYYCTVGEPALTMQPWTRGSK